MCAKVIKARPWQAVALGAATLAWAMMGTAAGATELSQVVQAALNQDARMAVAQAERVQAASKKDQAAALWRPQVMLSTTLGAASQDNSMKGAQFTAPGLGTSSGVDFATSVNGGTMARVTLGVVQPLLDSALAAGQAQLQAGAQMGELGWALARQNLVVAVSQQYWELALAQERVKLLQAQQLTLERQLEEAQDRFKLGAAPITDTHEARAALAQVKAQGAAASLDLRVRQQQLSDSTGLQAVSAVLPVAPGATPVNSLEQALQLAGQANKAILLQQQAVLLAQHALRKAEAQSGPTLNLVAEAAYDQIKGSGDFGQARNRATRAMVGVQGNWSLYSGGMNEAKVQEAQRGLDLEQAKLAQLSQSVQQETRQTWWSLEAEAVQLGAYTAALQAAQARLDATRLGREVGDRTHLDVLNASNEVSALELKVQTSRVAQLLLQVRLQALLATVSGA